MFLCSSCKKLNHRLTLAITPIVPTAALATTTFAVPRKAGFLVEKGTLKQNLGSYLTRPLQQILSVA